MKISLEPSPPVYTPSAHNDEFSPAKNLVRSLGLPNRGRGLIHAVEQGRFSSLRKAFQDAGSSEKKILEKLWGEDDLEEIFLLSEAKNPRRFFREWLTFGMRQEQEGRYAQAAQVYQAVQASIPEEGASKPLAQIRLRSSERLDSMGRLRPWMQRSSYAMGESGLEKLAGGISHAGALLGLATIFCSYLRPLRAFAPAGIHILSHPATAATLIGSGAYLLHRQAPEFRAATHRLWSGGYSGSGYSRSEDLLQVSGFGIGALGTALGFSSFALGARTFYKTYNIARLPRPQLPDDELEKLLRYNVRLSPEVQAVLHQGYGTREAALKVAYMQGDAVRRAVQDPLIWFHNYARGKTGLSPWQRGLLSFAGKWTDRTLLYGSALVGLGRFAHGLQGSEINFASLGLALAMDLSPAVTVKLYRMGRGDRKSDLGPLFSDEYTEAQIFDPALRRLAIQREKRGIPQLPEEVKIRFMEKANKVDFPYLEQVLRDAEGLTPLGNPNLGRPLEFPRHSLAEEAPQSPPGVIYSEKVRWISPERRKEVASWNLTRLRQAYASGELSPLAVFRSLLEHPDVKNGAIFPRPLDQGPLGFRMLRLARESERRFESGTARPLEGVLVAVKDTYIGLDGKMQMGSKTALVSGMPISPAVSTLIELGANPFPVNNGACANVGDGLHAGFGYIPHPRKPGYDPGGSSSGTAYVVGKKDIPVSIGEGNDVGGSTTEPAGAVGLPSFVPPAGLISTKGMGTFHPGLERVGVMGLDMNDVMTVSRYLTKSVGDDPHLRWQNPGALFLPAGTRPKVGYLESLLERASPGAQDHFRNKMRELEEQGYEVEVLNKEWDFLSEVPFLLYPYDAYVGAVFAHTNPLKRHRWEPPRRSLDENLLVRLPKGVASLEEGFYDRARQLSGRYLELVREKLGPGVVLASPSTEAHPTALVKAKLAGNLLDNDDRITMAKNRIPEWGQINLPDSANTEVGIALSGQLPDLMHFAEPTSVAVRSAPSPVRQIPPRSISPSELPPPQSQTRARERLGLVMGGE